LTLFAAQLEDRLACKMPASQIREVHLEKLGLSWSSIRKLGWLSKNQILKNENNSSHLITP